LQEYLGQAWFGCQNLQDIWVHMGMVGTETFAILGYFGSNVWRDLVKMLDSIFGKARTVCFFLNCFADPG
jgi:hypothetical protein